MTFWYSLTAAGLGAIIFGYHIAELNAPESVIRCHVVRELSGLPDCIPMSMEDYSIISSIYAVGGLIGALSISAFANKYGRLKAQLLNNLPLFVGSLLMTTAASTIQIGLGRFLVGVGSGAGAVVVPLYVHEICTGEQAARFGITTQAGVNLGILLTQTLGLFLSQPYAWRYIFGICTVITILQFVQLLFAEESPKWLESQGYNKEAMDTECRLHGCDVDTAETSPLLISTGAIHSKGVTMWEFGTDPQYRRSLIAVVGIMAAQQLTGINGIFMYGVAVLRDIMPRAAALVTVFLSIINCSVIFISGPVVQRLGRKNALLASTIGMGTSAFCVGLGIMRDIPNLTGIATLFFVISFSFGLGPVPWSLPSEIVEFRAVGAAQSYALASNWINTFVIAYGFPLLVKWFGKGGAFWVFTLVAVAFALFIKHCVPDTTGMRSPEEVWARFDEQRK